jgi:hypothetical protein
MAGGFCCGEVDVNRRAATGEWCQSVAELSETENTDFHIGILQGWAVRSMGKLALHKTPAPRLVAAKSASIK